MTGKFTKSFEVGARAITPNRALAPSDMFDILQEIATVHSDELGYDFEYFTTEKKGWTILNWYAELGRQPKWREKLLVETWPSSGKGLVAHRSFRILDEAGNAIMRVISQWVYFDLVRRRPIKISEEMREAYTSDVPEVMPAQRLMLPQPDESLKIKDSRFTVRRSHTDSNFHVNNVAYIKWMEDDIPQEAFYSGKLKSVYVNYRKEAREKEKILSSVYETEKGGFTCFLKSEDGNTFADAVFKYETGILSQ